MSRLKKDPFNIVICGIGGQGNIVASGLLGAAFVDTGCKVSVGETYGASQRGGSVMSHVRSGKEWALDKKYGIGEFAPQAVEKE